MRKKVDFVHILGMVMSSYHCGWQEVMSMPVRAFWALVAELPKLKAEASLQQINTMNTAMYGNKDYINALLAASGDSEDDNASNEVMDRPAMSMFKRSVR